MLHFLNKISLTALTCATVMMSSCGDIRRDTDNVNNQTKNFSVTDFTQINALEKKLAWSQHYSRTHFIDRIIPSAHAMLPPNFQPHYLKRFTFNHQEKTVKIINKRFRGLDSKNIQRSVTTKGAKVYHQFKRILSTEPLLCTISRPDMKVGPIPPRYFLTVKNKQIEFVDRQSWTGSTGYQLCSNELSAYINQF